MQLSRCTTLKLCHIPFEFVWQKRGCHSEYLFKANANVCPEGVSGRQTCTFLKIFPVHLTNAPFLMQMFLRLLQMSI